MKNIKNAEKALAALKKEIEYQQQMADLYDPEHRRPTSMASDRSLMLYNDAVIALGFGNLFSDMKTGPKR